MVVDGFPRRHFYAQLAVSFLSFGTGGDFALLLGVKDLSGRLWLLSDSGGQLPYHSTEQSDGYRCRSCQVHQ